MSDRVHEEISGLLAEYVAGTLSAAGHGRVSTHLQGCAECREDVANWQALSAGVFESAPAPVVPGPELLAGVLARIEGQSRGRVSVRRRLVHVWAVLIGQVGLVRPRLWISSALVMALGVVVAWAGTQDSAGVVLAMVAPLVAAIGVALVYGPDVDPRLEVALASPTAHQTVLLCRLTVVFTYDLVLALAASVTLSMTGSASGLGALVAVWLGPMALLSAISLLVSVWVGSDIAMTAAVIVWAVQLLVSNAGPWSALSQTASEVLWSTNMATFGLAALLLAVALAGVRRRDLPAAAG